MTLRKLSDADKQEILDLYRVPEETTSTIAAQYDVSPTTISRILRAGMSDDEYEMLAQQKRGQHIQSSNSKDESQVAAAGPVASSETDDEQESAQAGVDTANRRRRRRSSAEVAVLSSPAISDSPATSDSEIGVNGNLNSELVADDEKIDELPDQESEPEDRLDQDEMDQVYPETSLDRESSGPKNFAMENSGTSDVARPILRKKLDHLSDLDSSAASASAASQADDADAEEDGLADETRNELDLAEDDFDDPDFEADEDLVDDLDEDDDIDDDALDDLEDSDDLDDEDDDLDDDLDDPDLAEGYEADDLVVEVLPLTEADIPEPFYLVVDHVSELITRPLRDFRDLGQLPNAQQEERTLPVFGNHRVARRFCRKSHRIIKVADSGLLQIVSPYLQARGITRLLIDGHLYSI